ncbi:MAG: hypothetical protein JWQ56_3587 [Pseudarthrobacter sp.]|nr:hypothetical protein [Pseudarthrobacter sp.]
MVTFPGLGAPYAWSNSALQDGAEPEGGWDGPAVHCGTPMELVTPAVGPAAVGYTFEPDHGGPVQLPPVWRCSCGFQLDAWFHSPYASQGPVFGSGAAHAVARSA